MWTDSLGLMTDCEKNAIANGVAQATPVVGLGLALSDHNFAPFGDGPMLVDTPASVEDYISGTAGAAVSTVGGPAGEKAMNGLIDRTYRDHSTGNQATRRGMRNSFRMNANMTRKAASIGGKALAIVGLIAAGKGAYDDYKACSCSK